MLNKKSIFPAARFDCGARVHIKYHVLETKMIQIRLIEMSYHLSISSIDSLSQFKFLRAGHFVA
jgi:hypothetical protein